MISKEIAYKILYFILEDSVYRFDASDWFYDRDIEPNEFDAFLEMVQGAIRRLDGDAE